MSGRLKSLSILLIAAQSLSACGLAVPDMRVGFEDPVETSLTVNALVNRIQCELGVSIQQILYEYPQTGPTSLKWLESWAAKATLKLTVYEKSNLTPSVVFTSPTADYAFGLGANLSTSATRTETVDFFWIVKDLIYRDGPMDVIRIVDFLWSEILNSVAGLVMLLLSP